jgi:hypothetical protein
MNALKSVKAEWLIVVFVALFLAISFAPIPGLFEIVSIMLGVLTLLLLALLIANALRERAGN